MLKQNILEQQSFKNEALIKLKNFEELNRI